VWFSGGEKVLKIKIQMFWRPGLMSVVKVVWRTLRAFQQDRGMDMAAALTYYTLFALAPMLLLILSVVGLVFADLNVQDRLLSYLNAQFQAEVASLVGRVLENLQDRQAQGLARWFGLIFLGLAANGLVGYLQRSLYTVWKLRPTEFRWGMWLWQRLERLLVVIVFGFVWLSSTLVSNLLNLLEEQTEWLSSLERVNSLVFFVTSGMFLSFLIQTLVPKELSWKKIFLGSFVTVGLIYLGSFVVNLYLSWTNFTSVFGAASSLIVFLLWVYYSAVIFYFGMELVKIVTGSQE
jgi:membrane protein